VLLLPRNNSAHGSTDLQHAHATAVASHGLTRPNLGGQVFKRPAQASGCFFVALCCLIAQPRALLPFFRHGAHNRFAAFAVPATVAQQSAANVASSAFFVVHCSAPSARPNKPVNATPLRVARYRQR